MNILVINQPPYNRGDESAHKGLIRALLKSIPKIKIRVMSPASMDESVRQYAINSAQVEYIQEPRRILKFDQIRWLGLFFGLKFVWYFHPTFWKYKKIYQWADVVLCAPGGICMGGFQDWDHLFRLVLAKFYKRKLIYYGRSFGPFSDATKLSRTFKKISQEMLHYFSFLSIRDHETEIIAQKLGIPYIPTVDSAFLDTPSVELPYEIKKQLNGKDYMVFVPNYLLWHYFYKNKIQHETILDFYGRLIDEILLINPRVHIVMLPQLFCGHEYEFNDIDFFRDLATQKKDPRIIIFPDCYGSDIQQSIIKNAQYVIGSRYHSIVFAINQGVPCIALSYEHKMKGLMESLNLQKFCYDFTETLNSLDNQNKCLLTVRKLITILHNNKQAQAIAKAKAKTCFNIFLQEVNANP